MFYKDYDERKETTMSMTNKRYIELTKERAKKVYHETWEIRTLVAENDGVYTDDHHHMQTMAIQNLASDVQHLATFLERLCEKLDLSDKEVR